MPSKPGIEIYRHNRLVHAADIERPLELGRQERPEERLFCSQAGPAADRVAIAPIERTAISRKQLLIEPLGGGRLKITNLDSKRAVELADGTIGPGESRDVAAPYQFVLAEYRVCLLSKAEPVLAAGPRPSALRLSTNKLGQASLVSMNLLAPDDSESLIAWLQAITNVLQSAAHSADFFQQAAAAIVDLVGLDSGRVLLYESGKWNTIAAHSASSAGGLDAREPSHRMLEQVRAGKKTKTRQGPAVVDHGGSLRDIEAVVVSPIVDRQGDVIGVLYGDRLRGTTANTAPEITHADVMLMETLAGGLGAGLARLEQEQAAVEARVRFEQFFTPALARHLALDPNLLEGRDTEVSLLFCDIRGFSGIAEHLGAASTMAWINDVLGVLSQCVLDRQGVLVDYTGDELFAMWGAPLEQPDHAELACRAAVAMFEALPAVSRRWFDRLGAETSMGIGINTGVARVGNTGSQQKFKYGALGNAVNLCSRVQGATKYLRTKILITAPTRGQISDSFATRRLGAVTVVNIAEPVALYELCPAPPADFPDLCRCYEEALQAFEARQFERAMVQLCELLTRHPGDGPSLVLLSRLVPLLDDPQRFSPVWELPGK